MVNREQKRLGWMGLSIVVFVWVNLTVVRRVIRNVEKVKITTELRMQFRV